MAPSKMDGKKFKKKKHTVEQIVAKYKTCNDNKR